MSRDIPQEIKALIAAHPVVLFMKGTPEMPQCGFSSQVTQLLRMTGAPIKGVNVLADPELREEIKRFSNWPTIPQLYIKGEFVGGCDIVTEMYQKGELQSALKAALGDALKAPAKVSQVTPMEAVAVLKKNPAARLLDVRTEDEWKIVHVANSILINQEKADELVETLDRETPLFLMCHHGRRSLSACQFFIANGFKQVHNVVGGIDAWSQVIDPTLARY